MQQQSKTNRTLAIAAVALFLLSFLSYRESVERAERFERGQQFLPNLNPDEIAKVTLQKGEEETVLERRGDEFVVQTANGYPADNQAVNRFIKDVLDLSLEKEVGSGAELETELGLEPGGAETTEVVFANDAGKEMVRFLVGNAFEGEGGAAGNYVRRTDADENTIYLTSSRVYLETDSETFVRKEILDIERDQVVAIEGEDFRFARDTGDAMAEDVTEEDATEEDATEEDVASTAATDAPLELLDVPAGKKPSSLANQLKNVLSGLRFTENYLADAPEVRGLVFGPPLTVELGDQSGYRLAVVERGGDHFLRIEGFHKVSQVEITLDADEDEVRQTSKLLERGDEIQQFNELHGSWIYKVNESVANRVGARKADLLEDA